MKQYYDILELKEGATQEDIKKSYRRLSKKFHPDMNPDDKDAEEKFKKISEAYEILTGKQKPKQDNPFNTNHFRQRSFKAKPLKLVLNLELEEAYHGCNKRVNYQVKQSCGGCGGEGGFEPQACNQCGGKGYINQGPFIFHCNNCGGSGKIYKRACYTCHGQGLTNKTTHIDITIPKGITDDSIYTFNGVGNDINGGDRGDVYLIIKIKPNKTYVLEGLNLKRKLDVPIVDILLGTEKEFETLSGKVKIKIPKLSDLNSTFRLKGKGFIDNNIGISGDLYVTLNPIIPKELTPIEEDKLRQLKNLPNFNL